MKNHVLRFETAGFVILAVLTSSITAKAGLIPGDAVSTVASSNYNTTVGYIVDNQNGSYSNTFPAIGSVSGNYGRMAYSLTQSGGVAHLEWNGSVSIPSGDDSASLYRVYGGVSGYQIFTPTVNETYSISYSASDPGGTGFYGVEIHLYDYNLGSYIAYGTSYRDQFNDVTYNSSGFSGTLIAGHQYFVLGTLYIENYFDHSQNFGGIYDGGGATSGHWQLTAYGPGYQPTVPEPASFALLGLGGVGLAINANRRRRIGFA